MGVFDRLFRRRGRQPAPRRDFSDEVNLAARRILARYDVAQTTTENTRHWANADGLSADAANSSEVRRLIRNRARYEIAHNGYAKRVVRLIANNVIGFGPRLQVLGFDRSISKEIERKFVNWAEATRLYPKLHLMRRTRTIDGEAFGLLTTSANVDHPVKLNLRLFDAERCATPDLMPTASNAVDGIVFDPASDEPLEYHILRSHPGGTFQGFGYDRVPARFVLHYFLPDRPEQHRGICEILTSLPLGAQLRRYTLATLSAAEVAALLSVILKTDLPPNGEAQSATPFESLDLDRGMMVTAPAGWEPAQLRAEQPATVYPDFKGEIVSEIGAGGMVPSNLAKGDSSKHNFASGRLDHLEFDLDVEIDRRLTSSLLMDRILVEWLREAQTIPGYLPIALDRERPLVDHQWFYRGRERAVDPSKDSGARDKDLRNGTTNHAIEYAKRGLDWEEEQEKAAECLGISVEEYRAQLRQSLFGGATPVEEEQDEEAASQD